jgi:hypothetical protein
MCVISSVLLTKYHSVDNIKKTEEGRACSTHCGEMHTDFQWGNLKKRDHLEDLGVEERTILKMDL